MINLNISKVNLEVYVLIDVIVGSFNIFKGNLCFGMGLFKNGFIIDGCLLCIIFDGYIDCGSVDLFFWYLLGVWIGEKLFVWFNVFNGYEVMYQVWNGVDVSLVDDFEICISNIVGIEKEGEFYDNEVDDYE